MNNGDGTTRAAHSGLTGLPFWLVVGLMVVGAIFIFRHRKQYRKDILALALPVGVELFLLYFLLDELPVLVAAFVLLAVGVANRLTLMKRVKVSAGAAYTTWKAGTTPPPVATPPAEHGETAAAE
jgi:hypothetical protein